MKTTSYELPLARRIGLSLCLLTLSICAAQSRDIVPIDQPAKSIPLDQLGAEAQKQYSGDGLSVTATPSGVLLRCIFQKMEGQATREGLWLTSTADSAAGERFRVRAMAVGREGGPMASLPEVGDVRTNAGSARWERAGLAEEYSVSMDGVRQDFVIPFAPAGSGALRVQLEVSGAAVAPVSGGAKLTLTGSGRDIAYTRLRVTDAAGRVLESRMEVAGDHLVVVVADAGAAYPIRIDPTFSDANWVSMNPSISGTNGAVYACVADGAGNVYIGGEFSVLGNASIISIAKWNGSTWSALGTGITKDLNGSLKSSGVVRALVLDASGHLYVGGEFAAAGNILANNIAKWDGSEWSAVGSGLDGVVRAIVIANSGNLYAGGAFTKAGVVTANHLAKWNGLVWSAVGSGVNGQVNALALDPSGNIIAGGAFEIDVLVNGVPKKATHIAKWNGASWSRFGVGVGFYDPDDSYSEVYAVAVDSHNKVYAGNRDGVRYWTGTGWTLLMSGDTYALAVDSGDNLYAGGSFSGHIAKWDGNVWTSLGSGPSAPAMAIALDDSGTLFAGGAFATAGGISANGIAKWNGSAWSAMAPPGLNNEVLCFATDTNGNLYVGGYFYTVAGMEVNHIAKWNGSAWSTLGAGIKGSSNVFTTAQVTALVTDSKGNLYAGGAFNSAGEVSVHNLAKWNGTEWSDVGTGMDGYVNSLAIDASDNLYVGGSFWSPSGYQLETKYIAMWDGTYWWPLGKGLDWTVTAIAINAQGHVYAGGKFTKAGGLAANHVARWDGDKWSNLGTGVNGNVRALALDSRGTLYAGGDFDKAGTLKVNHIAKWDGHAWSAMGIGMTGAVQSIVIDANDTLYAAGYFTYLSDASLRLNHIALWDGRAWHAMGSGLTGPFVRYAGPANALALDSHGNLFVGGGFIMAGDKFSAYIAQAIIPSISVQALVGTNLGAGGTFYFGGLVLGTGSVDQTFTIKNTGTVDVALSGVTKSGGNSGDFILDASSLAASLAPGASTTFTINFTPGALGLRTTELQIDSEAAGSPFVLKLNGAGTFTRIAISGNKTVITNHDVTPRAADYTDFGAVVVAGGTLTRTFTIANAGTAPLHLSGTPKVQISGPQASDFTVTIDPVTPVAAAGNTTFTLTFDPQDQGLRTAVVSIANDDPLQNPYTFAISGIGIGLAQTITFGSLPNRYQADGSFPLIATASSGLPVTFSIVSGPATVVGNLLTPTGPGAVKVHTTQPGNAGYKPATAVDRTFTVLVPAKLTLVDLSQIYNALPRPIRAIKGAAYVDASFSYGTTNDPLPPTKVGSYPVKAVFSSETVTGKLDISKAPLQVIPDDQRKFASQANPALTLDYSGFLGSDDAANAVSKTPSLATTATVTSPGAIYPITATGGTSANYSFVYQKGSMKVETFAGLYEALLEEPMDGNPAAKLEINVAATSKSFTGKLTMPTETSAVALAGVLTTNVSAETASGSAIVTRGTGVTAATYVATFTLPLIGDFTATATRNGSTIGSSSEGKRLLVLPRGQTLSHAGAHTMRLAPAQALIATTNPIPEGSGYATATINATTGSMSLTGKLADGTPFTATLAADADAGYRLFTLPYTGRTGSYLAGWLDLTSHPDLTGRKFVSSASSTNLAWSKLGSAKDTSYRSGFGSLSTAVTLDPWLPPTTPFTLAQRLGLLSGQILLSYSSIEEDPPPDAEQNLPTLIKLSSTNAVSVVDPVTIPANSTNWRMTITPASGVFSGSFTISGTPARTVPFAGALRQPPSTEANPVTVGSAYYLLPAKVGAQTNEITSGVMLFERPNF